MGLKVNPSSDVINTLNMIFLDSLLPFVIVDLKPRGALTSVMSKIRLIKIDIYTEELWWTR